jgi:hypothetical protein
LLQPGVAQAESVADYGDGAEGHGSAGNHWVQQQANYRIEHASRNRDTQKVIAKSKRKILPDISHGFAAQIYGMRDAAQIPFYKRNACALDRNVGSVPHRYSDMSFRKSRSIVYSIAGHRHFSPLLFQLSDYFSFATW